MEPSKFIKVTVTKTRSPFSVLVILYLKLFMSEDVHNLNQLINFVCVWSCMRAYTHACKRGSS